MGFCTFGPIWLPKARLVKHYGPSSAIAMTLAGWVLCWWLGVAAHVAVPLENRCCCWWWWWRWCYWCCYNAGCCAEGGQRLCLLDVLKLPIATTCFLATATIDLAIAMAMIRRVFGHTDLIWTLIRSCHLAVDITTSTSCLCSWPSNCPN